MAQTATSRSNRTILAQDSDKNFTLSEANGFLVFQTSLKAAILRGRHTPKGSLSITGGRFVQAGPYQWGGAVYADPNIAPDYTQQAKFGETLVSIKDGTITVAAPIATHQKTASGNPQPIFLRFAQVGDVTINLNVYLFTRPATAPKNDEPDMSKLSPKERRQFLALLQKVNG